MLEREKLKKYLESIGINKRLLEMPAVIEPMLEHFKDKKIEDLKSLGIISVLENGDFDYVTGYIMDGKKDIPKKTEIKFNKETDGATLYYDYGKGEVNKYGIEERYEKILGYTDIYTRKNGKIDENNAENWYSIDKTGFDNGNCSILKASVPIKNYYLSRNEEREDLYDVDCNELMIEFRKNFLLMVGYYPKTAPWYEGKMKELKVAIEEYNKPENRIRVLENENRRLKEENKRLAGIKNEKVPTEK